MVRSRYVPTEPGRFYVRVHEPGGIRVWPDAAPPGTPHERVLGGFVGYRGAGPHLAFEPDGGHWAMLHERLDRALELLA